MYFRRTCNRQNLVHSWPVNAKCSNLLLALSQSDSSWSTKGLGRGMEVKTTWRLLSVFFFLPSQRGQMFGARDEICNNLFFIAARIFLNVKGRIDSTVSRPHSGERDYSIKSIAERLNNQR